MICSTMQSKQSQTRLGSIASFVGVTLPFLSTGCAIDRVHSNALNNPFTGHTLPAARRQEVDFSEGYGVSSEGQFFRRMSENTTPFLPLGARTDPAVASHKTDCVCVDCHFDKSISGLRFLPQLPHQTLDKMESLARKCPNPVEKGIFINLMHSKAFLEASVDEADKLIALAHFTCCRQNYQDFDTLLSRNPNDQPLLFYRDSAGVTLLDRLYELTTTLPIAEDLACHRETLAYEVMQLTAMSFSYDQGGTRACGEIAALLFMNNFSEYCRILNGLVSEQRKVQMAGGEWLKFVPHSQDTKPVDGWRQLGLSIICASLFEYANGPLVAYSPTLDANFIGPFPLFGTTPDMEARIISQLSGRTPRKIHDVRELHKFLKMKKDSFPPAAVALVSPGPFQLHWITVCRENNSEIEFLQTWGNKVWKKGERTFFIDSLRLDANVPIYSANAELFDDTFRMAIVIDSK